ncbi:MAG: hypothetical protein AVDCRST_MAG93-4008, partial [uncultured Chloroflexia bacterium]
DAYDGGDDRLRTFSKVAQRQEVRTGGRANGLLLRPSL